ncbi:MAG: Crp/Fnr family transcriptional regulator [Cytophagaceae bacterium]|jgi:CRP-like cAMP-binding protein|nr:Crp/Fnr family transcriptional regulator [Cytophagaceae bacterium]
MTLHHYLTTFTFLPPDITSVLKEAFVKKDFPKGSILIQPGKTAKELYFIEKGLLRGYYETENKEITYWFGYEGHISTSYYSFLSQTPALETIECIENLEVQAIQRVDLYRLYDQYPILHRLGKEITEHYYLQLEERFIHQHFKEAAERYALFSKRHPKVMQRAPLGTIASYLGITAETLSRIRAKK